MCNETDSICAAKWYYALGVYFCWGKVDMTQALEYYQSAWTLSDSTGPPSTIGQRALCAISYLTMITGNLVGAIEYAKKAQDYAEHLGDIYGQARSLNKPDMRSYEPTTGTRKHFFGLPEIC
jgi:hypothetical protein